VRVVFMGTPDFAAVVLERLLLDGYPVVAVYTQPDKVAGRGQALVASPVKRVALTGKIPVMQPGSFKETGVVAQLAGLQPDIIVVAAFGQLLPPSVLGIPPYGCLNVHPSLLPQFRGASPVAAAILAGNELTGVSVMLMDRGLDTGPVLARAAIPILPQDTTGSLTVKLSGIGTSLLLDVLPRWWRRELVAKPQDEGQATCSRVFSKQDGEIDWRLPAVAIWRQVRAFQPWPGCYTHWQGKQLKIIEAVPLGGESTLKVGQVIDQGKAGVMFGVSTGDGILGVLRLQMEGKRAMSATEFLRGQRQFIGVVLGDP